MVMHLAQAHALLVSGCDQAPASANPTLGGRPIPWVLGRGPVPVLCEPWSQVHRLHRKKRGFSACVARLQALRELAVGDSRASAPLPRLEIWADEGELDTSLIHKLTVKTGLETRLFPAAALNEALEAVRQAVGPEHVGHPNPLVASLAFVKSLSEPRPPPNPDA